MPALEANERTEFALVAAPVRALTAAYWRDSGWLLTIALVIVLIGTVCTVSAPYVLSRIVDGVNARTPDTVAGGLLFGFLAYAALQGVSTGLQIGVGFLTMWSAQALDYVVATSFFERIVRKTSSFFIEHNPAEIETAKGRAQNGMRTIAQRLTSWTIPGLLQLVLSVVLLGATIDMRVAGIVMVFGLVLIAVTFFANAWTKDLMAAATKASMANARSVGNFVNAMDTLRYLGGSDWVNSTFASKAREVRMGWTRVAQRRLLYAVAFGLILTTQLVVTFLLLMPDFQSGALSGGDLVLVTTLSAQLSLPFAMFGWAMDDIFRVYQEFKPFARMWAAPEDEDAGTTSGFRPTQGQIAFERVSFAYRDKPTLRNITFSAERGRVTVIMGETGSGKSTLFKLVLKSLSPNEGRILVDGVNLADIARPDWYDVIGVVPQEIMLLNDTLATNIAVGRPVAMDRLRDAARKAAILPFIEALPAGFETAVGERGLKLSGGERQRVAIARALYAEPEVLFLDEASSALDEATEAQIMGDLRTLADSVTILAITHRRSVVATGDLVVTLSEGGAQCSVVDVPSSRGSG